jgi:hypothetical protein
MKTFSLLAIFGSSCSAADSEEEKCFHPKLAQFDRLISNKYKRKFEFEVFHKIFNPLIEHHSKARKPQQVWDRIARRLKRNRLSKYAHI